MKRKASIWITVCLALLAMAGFLLLNAKYEDSLEGRVLNKDTEQQPKKGNPKSKVKLVLFGDYKCPYCGAFERNMMPKIQKDYIETDQVELRYVNVLVHGQESERSAKADLAVYHYAPEAYWVFHNNLYHQQPRSKQAVSEEKWLTDKLIKKQVSALDISQSKKEKILNAYRNDKQFVKDVKSDHQLAKKYKVPEVPSVYVNGKRIKDVTDYKVITDAIDKEMRAQTTK
ncbi:thioredoxin domain-containing protein [Staphylococcus sp. 17KM0847]|uniref:DsbA family protein n=1 Tax=Staphylococcus sp. 17KM0847 TaxID=2583989 RepID=UPI0015DDEF39|nr:thioredoxin domain-containing protein [Staphylococcus sp. 17KM0847]